MTTTDKRKAQQRKASKNNRQAKQEAGWKRIWIPSCLIETVKELLKAAPEIESLKKALRNYLEKHNKESEARYFLKEKCIEKDTIVECDCECCEVGRVLLNGHNTRS